MHEFMQAAERGDAFGARAEHQVIGVGEHDIGAGRAHVVVMHAFDRALGADRHEGGCAHHAMRGRDFAAPRAAVGCDQAEGEWLLHRCVMTGDLLGDLLGIRTSLNSDQIKRGGPPPRR